MFRFILLGISELSAVAFAIYLGFFLFDSPEFSPPVETAMEAAFRFCGLCVLYWWVQSGTLALSGVHSTTAMMTDILASLLPVLVTGFALLDFWRGGLPLSPFKQYALYFAIAVILADITFNVMIMTRLSRRYLGVS